MTDFTAAAAVAEIRASTELGRAIWLAQHWPLERDMLSAARQSLTSHQGLRGAIDAYLKVHALGQVAKREGWHDADLVASLKTAAPPLRDVVAIRAINIVGIQSRESYRDAINACSDGALDRDVDLNAALLMSFKAVVRNSEGAFRSKNAMAGGRGRGRQGGRRRRGAAAARAAEMVMEGWTSDEEM